MGGKSKLPHVSWTGPQKEYIKRKICNSKRFSWSDIHDIRKEMLRDFGVNRTTRGIVIGMRMLGKELGVDLQIGDKICASYSSDEKAFMESLIEDDLHFSLERLNATSDTMKRSVTGIIPQLVKINRNVTVDSRLEKFREFAIQKLDNPGYKPDKKKKVFLPPNKEGKFPVIVERFPQQSELPLKKKLTPVGHPDDPDALLKALDRVRIEADAIRRSKAELFDEYERLKRYNTDLLAENQTLREAFTVLSRKHG
jgi:hypothetical protein